MKKIERLLKYAEGGKVRKMQLAGKFDPTNPFLTEEEKLRQQRQQSNWTEPIEPIPTPSLGPIQVNPISASFDESTGKLTVTNPDGTEKEVKDPKQIYEDTLAGEKSSKFKLSKMTADLGVALAANVGMQAINAVDQATMGDKNFSASSQAIDTAVHGASGALMKSGNPYAMIAGVALEGLNWITKAGGKTVLGYDVNINNSGYGNMGHMESEAGRFWNNMDRKLAKRNEQARMALAASDISEDQAFEQEARTNSVTNVLQQNQIALAGGIDTSLLGS